MMAKRPCLGSDGQPCGMLVTPPANRCPAHQATQDRRQRGTTTQRGYGSQWQRHAKQAIANHLAAHGPTCPGWDRPPHHTDDLVCDHDVGPICRACNSRKAATYDRQARGAGSRRKDEREP